MFGGGGVMERYRREVEATVPRLRVSTQWRGFALFVAWWVGSVSAWAGVSASAHTTADSGMASAGLASLSVPAQAAIATALGRERGVYQAKRHGAGWRFDNPEHGLGAVFSRQGIDLASAGTRAHLSFAGVGRGARRATMAGGVPEAAANRIAYRRRSLVEWYVNGPLGIEQGITLEAPPWRATSEALTVTFRLTGDWRPEPGASGMRLVRPDGTAALHYRGLAAWDSAGRQLPAWWQSAGAEVFLRVDDSDARYPVTIDPFIQRARLTADDREPGDLFGYALAMSGATVVVGAYEDNGARGSAYVFVEPPGGWTGSLTQIAKLTASDGRFADRFGISVAIDGDTIVVGARGADVAGNHDQGAGYVFVKPPTGWANAVETAKLTASDGKPADRFGASVAVSGDTVVAGAFQHDVDGKKDQGAAYVFVKPPTVWASTFEAAKLIAFGGAGGDQIGHSVAASGDAVAVGGPGADAKAGAAYVFVQPAGGWLGPLLLVENATLTASDRAPGAQFGFSVAISGDTVVVGAPGTDAKRGSAYVYVKPPTGWVSASEDAKLAALTRAENDQFGDSVALGAATVLVGAFGDDGSRGSAYMFVEPDGGWAGTLGEAARLAASDGSLLDAFGSAVAVSRGTLAVGAPGRNVKAGEAYIFANIEDATPPDIDPHLSCTLPGQAGWCRGTAQLTWTVTDPESAVSSKSGCDATTITKDTAPSGSLFTCTATSAGGTASQPVTVFRDATPPNVTVTVPADRAEYSPGTNVIAEFACTDASSGIEPLSCRGTVPSGNPIDTASVGTKTFTVTATDRAGNTRSLTRTYQVSRGDTTPPVIAATLDCSAWGAASWCRDTLTARWTVTDPESPRSIIKSGCGDQTVTTDTPGGGTALSCTATSTGGTARHTVTLLRDATAPAITLARPGDGEVFAFNDPAGAEYACTDAASGAGACTGTVPTGGPLDTSSIGPGSFTVTATDQAGNTRSLTHAFQVVDRTPPVIKLSVPKKGARYRLGSKVQARFKCIDTGAGITRAQCRGTKRSGGFLDTARVGKHRFTVTAIDNAGNRVSRTRTYRVLRPPSGGVGGPCAACSSPDP